MVANHHLILSSFVCGCQVTDTDGREKVILHNLSFGVRKARMFALMGPSGAGKTTLLRIMGMWRQAGTLRATDLANISPEVRAIFSNPWDLLCV